jgi:transcriptional regulator with XRE-family HTH domain
VENVREWLKEARSKANLTMKQVSGKLGISESYYSAIESGMRQQKMDLFLASGLSLIFKIPVAQIAEWEQDLPSQPNDITETDQ